MNVGEDQGFIFSIFVTFFFAVPKFVAPELPIRFTRSDAGEFACFAGFRRVWNSLGWTSCELRSGGVGFCFGSSLSRERVLLMARRGGRFPRAGPIVHTRAAAVERAHEEADLISEQRRVEELEDQQRAAREEEEEQLRCQREQWRLRQRNSRRTREERACCKVANRIAEFMNA
jgi:hypothetical protein